jgi:hypothetical protein
MADIIRARTAVTLNNKRVSWKNVSYFTFKEGKEQNNTNIDIDIYWKYKASIISERVVMRFENNALRQKFFKNYGLILLVDDTFVNLEHILLIEEEVIHGANVDIKVRIVFRDGFEIVRRVPETNWLSWKRFYI